MARSTPHPAAGQVLAGVENRLLRWLVTVIVAMAMAVIMVVMMTAAIRRCTPVSRRGIVGRLGELIAGLRVLFAQRVGFLAQPFRVGGLVGGAAYDAHGVSISEDDMKRADAADAILLDSEDAELVNQAAAGDPRLLVANTVMNTAEDRIALARECLRLIGTLKAGP